MEPWLGHVVQPARYFIESAHLSLPPRLIARALLPPPSPMYKLDGLNECALVT
jgi:hypothetical protein